MQFSLFFESEVLPYQLRQRFALLGMVREQSHAIEIFLSDRFRLFLGGLFRRIAYETPQIGSKSIEEHVGVSEQSSQAHLQQILIFVSDQSSRHGLNDRHIVG
jgi:hypothetical protein